MRKDAWKRRWLSLLSVLQGKRPQVRGARRGVGIEKLETRLVLAAPQPFPLGALNGANGSRLTGVSADDFAGITGSVGDVNGDGFDDIFVGAPGANVNGTIESGQAYVLFGKPTGFVTSFDLGLLNGTNGFVINGANADSRLSLLASSAGDINGDGYDDVLLAASRAKAGELVDAGAVYVVFGKAIGFPAQVNLAALDGQTGFRLEGNQRGMNLGSAVTWAGDVNGDGFDDLLVGAPGDPIIGTPETSAGSAYLMYGKASGFASSINVNQLTGSSGFLMRGIESGDRLGSNVARAGDLNNDGFGDFVVAANQARISGTTGMGAFYVVFGGMNSSSASFNLATLNGANGFVVGGTQILSLNMSNTAAGIGDFNGDGFEDLGFGSTDLATENPNAEGSAYVVLGRATYPSFVNLGELNGTTGFRLLGAESRAGLGISIVGAGDMNADGLDDFAIGANLASPQNRLRAGEVYVVFGESLRFGGAFDLTTLNGTNGFRLDGDDGGDQAGASVASIGDVNGDGFTELLIGAPLGTSSALTNTGETYLIYGGNFTSEVTHLGTTSNETLTGTSSANLMSGGRGNDALIGMGGQDVLLAGFGDDLIAITSTNFARIDGGAGNDTVRFDGQEMQLDLTNLSARRLTNIERFDIRGAGANSLTINPRNVMALTRGVKANNVVSHTLIVHRDPNDRVNLGSEWGTPTNETIASEVFDVYRSGTAVIKVTNTAGRLLEIVARGNESIRLTTEQDRVVVLRNGVADNNSTSLAANEIGRINITGSEGHNRIDVSVVTTGVFTRLSEVIVNGGAGNDTLIGSAFADVLNGGTGNDLVDGGDGNDTIQGGSGNDLLRGNAGHDNLNGGSQHDILEGAAGNDVLFAGTGNDRLVGGDGNDSLLGGSDTDTLIGNAGDDLFDGGVGAGVDVVDEAGNNNFLLSDAGRDEPISARMIGSGNDTFLRVERVLITGGSGANLIDASLCSIPVTMRGGAGNDTLYGGRNADLLEGGDGNDSVIGSDGADTIRGDVGHDTLLGGSGHDVIDGGEGSDIVNGDSDNDTLTGGIGEDILNGGDGSDSLAGGDQNDTLNGGSGNDTLIGGAADDVLVGMSGNDVLQGDAGLDTLLGGEGNDQLLGGEGADIVVGGLGNDAVRGNSGSDILVGGRGGAGSRADSGDRFDVSAEILESFAGLESWTTFA